MNDKHLNIDYLLIHKCHKRVCNRRHLVKDYKESWWWLKSNGSTMLHRQSFIMVGTRRISTNSNVFYTVKFMGTLITVCQVITWILHEISAQTVSIIFCLLWQLIGKDSILQILCRVLRMDLMLWHRYCRLPCKGAREWKRIQLCST